MCTPHFSHASLLSQDLVQQQWRLALDMLNSHMVGFCELSSAKKCGASK